MVHINLDAVDTDGAIAEAAEEVAGDTRLSFLRKGALAGGAAVSGGAILSTLLPGVAMAATKVGAPPASFGKGDIGILNYALTLEYLESAYYNAAAKAGKVTHKQLKQFLATAQKDENAHVKLLKSVLGSKAVKSPKFNFQGIPADQAKFAATAYVLENTGVHAYLGQAPNISAAKVLLAAAEIVTVEARHAGAIALYLGMDIAPTTTDTGWTAAKVLSAVGATGFIKS
jgi:Ferritin-like domain